MKTRFSVALAGMLLAAACDQAQDLGRDDPSRGPDDAGPSSSSDAPSSAPPAADAQTEPDAAIEPVPTTACTGNTPCDPLANFGCGSGKSCLVSLASAGPSSAACETTIAQASVSFGKDCPCGPGLACVGLAGRCTRICDFTHGTPVLDHGQPIPDVRSNNPECLADSEAKRAGNTACRKVGSCFGMCDALGATIP